jgi:hypothetical protein
MFTLLSPELHLDFVWTTRACVVLLLDISTPQGPELHLVVSTLQKSVLPLDVSTPQGPEMQLDLSGQQEPELPLFCSWTCLQPKSPVLHLVLAKHGPELHLDMSEQLEPFSESLWRYMNLCT